MIFKLKQTIYVPSLGRKGAHTYVRVLILEAPPSPYVLLCLFAHYVYHEKIKAAYYQFNSMRETQFRGFAGIYSASGPFLNRR